MFSSTHTHAHTQTRYANRDCDRLEQKFVFICSVYAYSCQEHTKAGFTESGRKHRQPGMHYLAERLVILQSLVWSTMANKHWKVLQGRTGYIKTCFLPVSFLFEVKIASIWCGEIKQKTMAEQHRSPEQTTTRYENCLLLLLTVCRVCSEGVLWMRMVGCGLRVGLGEAELTRGAVGILSCSMLLERPPFTSLPTLLRPMEEKKRRRNSFGRPSSFL